MILGILALAVFFAVRHILHHKSSCAGCSGCAGCSRSGECQRKPPDGGFSASTTDAPPDAPPVDVSISIHGKPGAVRSAPDADMSTPDAPCAKVQKCGADILTPDALLGGGMLTPDSLPGEPPAADPDIPPQNR